MRHPFGSRRAWRASTTVALVAALVLCLASAAVASFDGSRSVGANQFSTRVLQPPSGLSLTATCTGGSTGGVPAFVSGRTATGFGASLVIPTPAGVVAGDVLVAQLVVDDTTAVSAAGWTMIRQDKDTNEGLWAASLYRVAGGSEPASFTFTFTQTVPGESAGGISAYRGVDTADPVDAHDGQITTFPPGAGTVTAPSITTSSINTRLVGFFGRDDGQVLGAPGTLTTRWHDEVSSPSDAAALSADQAWPTPGPTGTRVATAGGTNNGIGQLLALAPESSGGTAGVDAAWTATTSGFASGYRLQRWKNGALDDETTIVGSGSVGATDQPVAAGTTYEYRLVAEYENWTSPVVSATVTTGCTSAAGTVLWRQVAKLSPLVSTWNGTTFSPLNSTVAMGEWRVMQAAAAPTRDEVLAVGVNTDGKSNAIMRTGATWADPFGASLGSPTENFWWGADVAYESVSGDAMLVWNNGTGGLAYRVWDGTGWTAAAALSTPVGGEAQQLHLAADPTSDEMVLVGSNDASEDFAMVWDGSAWGSALVLDPGGGNDRTDVNVAYEAQSGRALVVYALGNGVGATAVRYRSWGGSWSGEGSLAPPVGLTGAGAIPRWTTLASDPGSDRIALGTLTFQGDIWLATWSGSAWADVTLASTTASSVIAPVVAVAFEATSGAALATYAESGSATVRTRTWSAGGGWGAETAGPTLSGTPNSMTLDPRPGSDQVALLAQDANRALSFVLWNGTAWSAVTVLETETGETKNQPFAWVWE